MDTLAINPTITTLFAALGAIGSLWIHVAKKFDPAFRIKFDTVWTDEERQAYTLRVGGVLIVIGSALWLGWRYINGDFPADPRDAVVFALGAVGQLITNVVGYLMGNVSAFQSIKHLMAPAVLTGPTPPVHISFPTAQAAKWMSATEWPPIASTGSTASQSPDSVHISQAGGASSFTADDSQRGGGAA